MYRRATAMIACRRTLPPRVGFLELVPLLQADVTPLLSFLCCTRSNRFGLCTHRTATLLLRRGREGGLGGRSRLENTQTLRDDVRYGHFTGSNFGCTLSKLRFHLLRKSARIAGTGKNASCELANKAGGTTVITYSSTGRRNRALTRSDMFFSTRTDTAFFFRPLSNIEQPAGIVVYAKVRGVL